MVKKILILSISLILLLGSLFLIAIAPYHIYTLSLTEGVNTRFMTINPSGPVFYDGNDLSFNHTENENLDNSLFKEFHLYYFLMPLPYNHPIYSMIPTIKNEIQGPRLGASFIESNNSELISFQFERPYKFETISGGQKIFTLPVFRNYINRKTNDEIWRDLFYKKLFLPSNSGESFYKTLQSLKTVKYNDLVYNLYIFYNRTHLFSKDIRKISYNKETNQGIVELQSEDPKVQVEQIYLIEKGIVYSFILRTRRGANFAENFRNKILSQTKFKNSTTDSAIPIYAQYQNINYENRIDQQGMIYLFTAWSHDLSNKEFIRVIILFLERGKSNLKFLKPFYDYAFKKFGSNLSGENQFLLETPAEKLKRKLKDEVDSEIKKEESNRVAKPDENFNTGDEKMKYYLQKAKEEKRNIDDTDKVLIQE